MVGAPAPAMVVDEQQVGPAQAASELAVVGLQQESLAGVGIAFPLGGETPVGARAAARVSRAFALARSCATLACSCACRARRRRRRGR